jgi:hypothetical protein
VTGRHTDWDKHLCEAQFAYNYTHQESVRSTPFRLTFGQDPTIPFQEVYGSPGIDVGTDYVPAADVFVRRMHFDLARAKSCLRAAQDRMRRYADATRRDLPPLQVGQEVLLMTKILRFKHTRARKLKPWYMGPFRVSKVASPVAYPLQLPRHLKLRDMFHVSMLKPYRSDGRVQTPPPPEVIDGELEFEVQSILAHQSVNYAIRKSPASIWLNGWVTKTSTIRGSRRIKIAGKKASYSPGLWRT